MVIGIATWGTIPSHEKYLTPPSTHTEAEIFEAQYPKPQKVDIIRFIPAKFLDQISILNMSTINDWS